MRLIFAITGLLILTPSFLFAAAPGPLTDQQVSELVKWFGQPIEQRAALPKSVLRITGFDGQREAAYRAQVWKAFQKSIESLPPAEKLPELPPTLQQIIKMPKGQRPALRPATIQLGDKAMPYFLLARGEKPASGWPLYIAMHGGGKSSKKVEPHGWDVNNREWQAQLMLFQGVYADPGLYFIPRMVDDNDGRWRLDYNRVAFERVIRQAIALRDVDPNRVYLMGISQGAYGTQKLGPRMADRFAGLAPMAGGTPMDSIENLRNVYYHASTGENDKMFDRIKHTQASAEKWRALRLADPQGYEHTIDIQKGRGHGIDYRPATQGIGKHVRNPTPDRITWSLTGDAKQRANLYWLGFQGDTADKSITLDARIDRRANAIRIATKSGAEHLNGGRLFVYLSGAMLDLENPITIAFDGQVLYNGTADRQIETLIRSLDERGDPSYMFPVEVTVDLPTSASSDPVPR